MAASPTFHSCPASTEEELNILVEDGAASRIEFEFRYELDTAPASSVGAAVERVEAAMLQSLAARSGLVNCAGAQQPWRHLQGRPEVDSVENDRRSGGRRSLRGGRGSNSLVGLSSLEPDEILTIPCKSPANPPADPFDDAEVDGEEGFAGAVVIGNPGEASAAPENDGGDREQGLTEDIVLASTRIDGKLQIERSIHRPDHSGGIGDEENGEGVAFNYISTQSEPKEAHSHGAQNSDYPSVVPAMFRQGARMAGGPAQTPSSNTIAKVPRSADDPMSSTHIHIEPRNMRKCTVVLGKMTAYSSNPEADPFENIEGRLVAALEEELNGNPVPFQEIGGVRMHDSVAAPGAQISAARAHGAGGSKYDALPAIVLVSLACVLVIVAGLFITTNRRGKKDQWDEDLKRRDSSQGTYHDDEVEVDALDDERDFVMSVGSGDDYSVGRFSVSSARDSLKKGALAARSVGSGGKRSGVGGSRDRSGIASARDRAVSPEARSILTDLQVEQSTPSNGQWEREDSLTVANRDAMPVQSSTFGLIAARPRAASPDSEFEVEVHSVYDCDASVTHENDARAHRVHRPPPDPNAAAEAERRAANKAAKMGAFAGMFHKKNRGTPAMQEKEWGVAPEPTFTYDEAERAAPPRKTKAALARSDEDAGRAATPNLGPGCGLLCDAPADAAGGGRSLLQFFAAREPEGARHAEVEASLRPFDGASDHSAGPVANGKRTEPVDTEGIFLGKTAGAGRARPNEENVENGADGNHRRRLRKFGDMIRRPLSKDAGDGNVNVAIREVHIEAPPSPRRRAQEPRPVYTMQHRASASPRRPVRSPSTLSGRRSRSNGGGLASSDALQENGAGWRVPAASWDAPKDASPTKEEVPRIVARMEGAPPAEDDGSSAMQAYNPDMCGVGETIDCASPSAWWPDLFWSKE